MAQKVEEVKLEDVEREAEIKKQRQGLKNFSIMRPVFMIQIPMILSTANLVFIIDFVLKQASVEGVLISTHVSGWWDFAFLVVVTLILMIVSTHELYKMEMLRAFSGGEK